MFKLLSSMTLFLLLTLTAAGSSLDGEELPGLTEFSTSLDFDDECGLDGESDCALNALQHAGKKQSTGVAEEAPHAPATDLHQLKKVAAMDAEQMDGSASFLLESGKEIVMKTSKKNETSILQENASSNESSYSLWWGMGTPIERETHVTCMWGSCASSMGPVECHHLRCICKDGFIFSNSESKCVPKYDVAAKRETGTSCWWHACGGLQSCISHRCVCNEGFEAYHGACLKAGTAPKIPHSDSSDKGPCKTAVRGDKCSKAVEWAMHTGIYESPQNYKSLHPGMSSAEEFQDVIHRSDPTTCPRPCLLRYPTYNTPSFRDPKYRKMKGVAYGPSPLKSHFSRLLNDDFMSEITGAMWADWGRGDMALIKSLGGNTMRLYGNDANTSHRAFLDAAFEKGIDIVAGMSDFGFSQGPNNCLINHWYCFDEAYFYYHQQLKKGFAIDDFKRYHPAFKAMIICNEPDLKIEQNVGKANRAQFTCRAMASIFDALLQAEKDVGVRGNPIAFTTTWAFANYYPRGHFPKNVPALNQMEEFWRCVQDPLGVGQYRPKNDLQAAFRARFVNSFNTQNNAKETRWMMLNKYARSSFWTNDLKIPVFIGEYHNIVYGVKDDLKQMMDAARSERYPFFMGYNFFEFSKRYDKYGNQPKFGLFGYGDCALLDMNYTGQVYTIWNLKPETDKHGFPLVAALKRAFGTGENVPALSHPHLPCMSRTLGVQ
eukprot:TRINITY_DN5093_c0_g2_i5.p1 TRINITY_DN5093_c0_g2~~TRINITY_DN5093_c0_g2_i5.p1  ORF type:complete len:716 (+),score=113.82 TRINITY_DN5093_c0_g2_i5:137-2284(+)